MLCHPTQLRSLDSQGARGWGALSNEDRVSSVGDEKAHETMEVTAAHTVSVFSASELDT